MESDTVAVRCAIYTRKSTGNRLESAVNSLTTQREVCSAYIRSQEYKAWVELPDRYDDGGQTGSNLERPALAALMGDIEKGKIDTVVVYKIDRLTRSLVDFVRLVDLFEQRKITLVSISQAFDTSDSMGRMVLNILLTFSQFEREMIGERVRESLRARKRHGKIHGGMPPFGYRVENDTLIVDEHEASIVRFIFDEFIKTERYNAVQNAIDKNGFVSSIKHLRKGGKRGGTPVSSSVVYAVLRNPIYIGEIRGHDGNHAGHHEALIPRDVWEKAQRIAQTRLRPKPNSKGTGHFLASLLRDELGRTMYLDIQRPSGQVHTYYSSTDASWTRQRHIKAYRTHAGRFDKLIKAALADFLCDRVRLRDALKELGLKGNELEKIAATGEEAANRLEQTELDNLEEVFEALLVGIEIGKERVFVTLRPIELRRFIEWDEKSIFRSRPSDWPLSEASYNFELAVRVISPEKWPTLSLEPRSEGATFNQNAGLIKLVHQAQDAQRLMCEHRELSIPELAEKSGMRPSQFSRYIRLNYLAPDIIASILDGTQPEELSRKHVLSSSIPTDWALQRRLFGFSQPMREVRVPDGGLWKRKSQ